MITQRKIETAMRIALANAKRFLEDSRILQKEGSIGHATSLAILGYEETHKAYLIINFHPFLNGVVSEEHRSKLRSQLLDHSWKHIHAKEFRTGLEGLLESGSISEEERTKAGIPPLSELRTGTNFAFSERLDKMKNDGFYSGPFADPVWDPSSMEKKTLKDVQNLLETQIQSVETTVKWLSHSSLIPKKLIDSVKMEIAQVMTTLGQAQANGVTDLDELAKRLSRQGDVGHLVSGLASVRVDDERLKKIKREKKRKARSSKRDRSNYPT